MRRDPMHDQRAGARPLAPREKAYLTVVVLVAALLSGGCGYGADKASGREMPVSNEASISAEPGWESRENPGIPEAAYGESRQETGESSEKESQEEGREEVPEEILRRAENMDFTPRQSPVDRQQYDDHMDGVYKEAFLKAVTNEIPIYLKESNEAVFYKELLYGTEEPDENVFQMEVRESDYFYQDFDEDGLPELIADTQGPCVLRYDHKKDRVELYYRKEKGWKLLGTGQMYAVFVDYSHRYTNYLYCYESMDKERGLEEAAIYDEYSRCTGKVSIGGYRDIMVSEEAAQSLRGACMDAMKNPPHPLSFDQLFGSEGSRGYMPGEEPCRYWLEHQEALPVNEEKGEEWEAYKAMMEGDFSLVDDERWGILQSDYEDNLAAGRESCSWSYFLMDFNGDGVKELIIRTYPEGVNHLASFRYEDGRIKMWGSYNSADYHGYALPLANGRVLSVYWYQNDKVWWVMRLDSQGWLIKERCYSKTEIKEPENEEQRTWDSEKKAEYCYDFQDYYHDGELCGSLVSLSEEEWEQVEEMIEGLMIPEDVWQPCSVLVPKSERPAIPAVG